MNYIDSSLKVVGTRPIRPDGVDKVTGRAMFAADTRAAGMLWGKILRSPHAHARIVKIDTSKARAAAGREGRGDRRPISPTSPRKKRSSAKAR